MNVFHGTQDEYAEKIMGPPASVDVNMGRGELGVGFYAGDSEWMAAALAKGRGANPAIVKIDIDMKKYITLSTLIIRDQSQVFDIWTLLQSARRTRTYRFDADVIIGPFATYEKGTQFKFESIAAQDVLNKSLITRTL